MDHPVRIDVLAQDSVYVKEPLVPNDPAQAKSNTARMQAIMEKVPSGAAVYFPVGHYYFDGAGLPNRSSIETSKPGQTIYGDGAELTVIFQTNLEKNFGFQTDAARKHVPASTIRIRHKGCTVRNLTIAVDPNAPNNAIAPSAAIQLAHIAYFPDHNIGIIETTGIGEDFLLDNIVVKDVNIGVHYGGGIQGTRFFEIGIDIIGSGGMVKVSHIDRLDAKYGIRLDNGNHCGQGNYYFDHIYMIGKHGVTNGGVFFDWIGGQLAVIRDCEATFTNAFHAGPLGADGDRLEPFPEGEVRRSKDRMWDWLTWHGHGVAAAPNAAQITEWYGLPRRAEIVRIGSLPRTGDKEWKKGEHFTTERIEESGPLQHATKIIWIKDPPGSGSVYFVTFSQTKEYRVHDIEWGSVTGCFFGEARQADENGYVFKFEDQGFGHLNPDFGFPVGYGFSISGNTYINGDGFLMGNSGYIRITENTAGVSNLFIQGTDDRRCVREISFDGNQLNNINVSDFVSHLRMTRNRIEGRVLLNAATSASHISLEGNTITWGGDRLVSISGKGVEHVIVTGNTIAHAAGSGIFLEDVNSGMVKDNDVSGCGSAGME
ncbi:right-handed parallel beta-helix repeat-containing protein, partial [Candidatus Sumerlaeota bacterium]|nr:right-handed parallel beta-helix repeat-containing protein [Candidatus Sumerlaeota bacterium]